MATSNVLLRRLHLLSSRHLSTAQAIATTPTPNPPSSISQTKSIIRTEPDPDRLADLFLSSIHQPAFRGDRPLYSLSVRRLSRARRPDLIERLLDAHLSTPFLPKSEGLLIRLISLYSSASMPDHAAKAFHRMPSLGLTPSDRSLCALLSAFFDNNQLDRLREAFHAVPNEVGISPGVPSYNVFLKGLCLGGDLDTARKVLDEMANKGVAPDIHSYNTLLNGFLKKGDEEGFEVVLKEIRGKGLNLDVGTYNCRISALVGKGKCSEAEELLTVMFSKKAKPNRASFSKLIDGYCKEGDVNSAMRVFKRMQGCHGISPDSETYVVLTKSLVEKGEFGSALSICHQCLKRKWAPPFETMKGLVEGLTKNSQVDEAKEIVKKMKFVLRGDAIDSWKKVEDTLVL